MIRHLFKLIWNQKRKNLGLSFELFFSFIVLFALFSFSFHFLKRYLQPLGFEYENVWMVNLNWNETPDSVVVDLLQLIRQDLDTYSEIENYAFTDFNSPFTTGSFIDLIHYEEAEAGSDIFTIDDNFPQTMGVEILSGRWFTQEDEGAVNPPAVITKHLKEDLFGEESPLGKSISYGENSKCVIVGVSDNYRYRGEMERGNNGIFVRAEKNKSLPKIMLKVNAQANASFESRLLRKFQQIASEWSVEIAYLEDMRKNRMKMRLIPILILSIISGFLIFNVALGLFGVLWQNISKRTEEIGVRRAMGSTRRAIMFQFIGETAVLATLSILVGIFFAVQFPLLNVFNTKAEVYVWGIFAAIFTIYFLVVLCALFPSKQAAQLHPAEALREE